MKNTYMFQYATRHSILENTGLISKDEAEGLFCKNKEDFKQRLINGESPEMCIWINCKDESSYGETSIHWDDSIRVIDGNMYQLVRI